MPEPRSVESEEDIVQVLLQRAAELWGPERLEAIRPKVVETARQIRLVSQSTPGIVEEPATPF